MRLKFLSSVVLLLVSFCSQAADLSLVDAKRTLYGYFNSEYSFGNVYGFSEINTYNLENPQLIFNFPSNDLNPLFAGAGYDGVIYGLSYQWNGSMNPTLPDDLIAYNIDSGRVTHIGPWGTPDSGLKPQDMTYDQTTGTMYVMAYDGTGSLLMKADLETGALETVCEIRANQSFMTLAANRAGELFTIGIDGVLYKLNKTNGVVTSIFNTGLAGFYFLQTMEFDPTTGNILWAANASSYDPNNVVLMEIDLTDSANPSIDEVGVVGNRAIFNALYIPGASSYSAPAAPDSFVASTPVQGSFEAVLSWINPTTTFGNAALSDSDFNGIVIFRDGKQISVITDCKTGQAMTYIDTELSEPGEYRYDIIALGTGGESMKATYFLYIGEDMPSSVITPKIEGVDDYSSAVISWQPVTMGYHNGYLVPESVKYKVVRRPDNKIVGDNITETSIIDNSIVRTLNYNYDVIAFNEIGEAPLTSTSNLILGPAFDTPFVEEFDSDKEALNRWIITDGNGDFNTWMFNSTAGSQFFGDYETALEYLISPIMSDQFNDADEWIVSGPIKFEADKKYEIELAVRSIATETLEVAIGPSEIPVELQLAETVTIKPSEYIEGDANVRPSYYTVQLPTEGLTTGSVGLHLCTPIDPSHYAFLQICSLEVREGGTGSVDEVSTPLLFTRFDQNQFDVIGEFDKIEIYSVSGSIVIDTAESTIDLTNLDNGIYVAVIHTPSGLETVKFAK